MGDSSATRTMQSFAQAQGSRVTVYAIWLCMQMPCCASIHKLHTGIAFCIGSATQVMEVP